MSRLLSTEKLKISDMFGASISGLCALHCALSPLLFISKPLTTGLTDHHHHGNSFWAVLDFVFLALSLVAVWYSSTHTSIKASKWLLWLAWFALAFGIVAEHADIPNGTWLMYAGSISLIIIHIRNYGGFKETTR